MTEDEMVGWHHQLNGHEFEQAPGDINDTMHEIDRSFLMAQTVNAMQRRRPGFNPWFGKILWRRVCQSTPVLLPGKFHGQRSLEQYSPWGCKELDMTE